MNYRNISVKWQSSLFWYCSVCLWVGVLCAVLPQNTKCLDTRVACKNCKTCILCFFGTVRVPIVHFQKDFDNFYCKHFRPPAFLNPIFLAWTQIIRKNGQKRLFRFAWKYSINRKNKLLDPYKAFWNHCGSNFSDPLDRENKQKRQNG